MTEAAGMVQAAQPPPPPHCAESPRQKTAKNRPGTDVGCSSRPSPPCRTIRLAQASTLCTVAGGAASPAVSQARRTEGRALGCSGSSLWLPTGRHIAVGGWVGGWGVKQVKGTAQLENCIRGKVAPLAAAAFCRPACAPDSGRQGQQSCRGAERS